MAYKALYRTYRPSNFNEVAGQKYIVRTLQNAVNQNKIAHAYLFCGPRGTGKTSIAKIFAKAVNCERSHDKPCLECDNCKAVADNSHPDIVEIDAASNNGVEEVRNLIEKVKYAPIMGKYKVYIIDEVHMMSTGAFNALLKTIEEPPAHVIFILATTEPHKVIPTIISRCQRFDFTKIAPAEMVIHIKEILEKEHIVCEDEVVRIIAQLADGGMRDALSILDQCIAYAQDNIKVHHINEIYGITTTKEKLELFRYIYSKDIRSLLDKVKIMIEKGIDIKRLTFDMIEILKDSVVYDYTKDTSLLKMLNTDEVKQLNQKPIEERLSMIDTLMESYDKYRFAANVGAYFEICLLKMLETNKTSVEISTDTETTMEEPLDPIVSSTVKTTMVEKEVIPETVEDVSRETLINQEEIQSQMTNLVEKETEEEPLPVPTVEIEQSKIAAPQKEELKQVKNANGLDDEIVLQLLVGANKPEKQKDMECFMDIERYTVELDWAKPANALRNAEIMASSAKYIVLAVDNQPEANDINERDSHNEFREFTHILLHSYKKIFAVPQEQKNRVIREFKERMMAKTLPQPMIFEEQKQENITEKEKTEVDLVKDLFGKDVIITEE